MSRERWSLLLLTIFLMILLTVFIARYSWAPPSSGTENNVPSNDTPNNSPNSERPPGPILVAPETPLGMIGAMTAIVAGVATFAFYKRRK